MTGDFHFNSVAFHMLALLSLQLQGVWALTEGIWRLDTPLRDIYSGDVTSYPQT